MERCAGEVLGLYIGFSCTFVYDLDRKKVEVPQASHTEVLPNCNGLLLHHVLHFVAFQGLYIQVIHKRNKIYYLVSFLACSVQNPLVSHAHLNQEVRFPVSNPDIQSLVHVSVPTPVQSQKNRTELRVH